MATTTRLSLDEFLARPDTKPASEWVCGEVSRKPMRDSAHAAMQSYFIVLLFQYLARTRLGRAGPEWRCIFGPPGGRRA